nr:MAG TPA: hypothetical protein [Caudoviricetes sp.]
MDILIRSERSTAFLYFLFILFLRVANRWQID